MNSCSSSEHEVSPEDYREEAEETVEEVKAKMAAAQAAMDQGL